MYAKGLANRIVESMDLLEVVSADTINSPAFKKWFGNSKVVDVHGNPLPVYHGTGRPDRVGTQFKKSRATAGPMAYFTENPQIASNYAETKPDTSHVVENYADWFMVKLGRSKINIVNAWNYLPNDEKERMKKLAPRVTSETGDDIVLGDEHVKNGNGGYHPEHYRGNVLAALFYAWVEGGTLYDEEEKFLEVLKLAGMTTPVIFEHPHVTFPAVYQVFLSIQHPLYTDNIPEDVVQSLTKIGKKKRGKGDINSYYDQWNKQYSSAADWLHSLANNSIGTWTVIPDWVTDVLKAYGYDGIKDVGGKLSGDEHTVWIPFEEYQVKSAISNTNFDSSKKNIHH